MMGFARRVALMFLFFAIFVMIPDNCKCKNPGKIPCRIISNNA